ncbi:hypothetical protein SUGI_1068580 [Cryptomeria japonica]|nr:hypothetical protein SUGI_1068580 [Cryptomeria japonica]
MAYIWIYTAIAGHPWSLLFGIVVLFWRRIISLLWQIVLSFRRDGESVEEKEEKDLDGHVPDRFSVEGEDEGQREGRWIGRPVQLQRMTVRFGDLITEYHDCNELISHVHEGVVDSGERNDDLGFCMRVGCSEESLENVSETIANAGAVLEQYKTQHRNGRLEDLMEDRREEEKDDLGFSMGVGASVISLENVSETIANAGAVIELYKAHHRGGGLGEVDQTREEDDHVGPDEDTSISGGDEDTSILGGRDVLGLNHEDTSVSGVGIVLGSNHEDTSISGAGIVLGSNDEDTSMSGGGDVVGSNENRPEVESSSGNFLCNDVSEDPCPEMFQSISHTEEQEENLQSYIQDSFEDSGDGDASVQDRGGDTSVQDGSCETNGDALQTEPDTQDQEEKMQRVSNEEEHNIRLSDDEVTTSTGHGDALVQDAEFETNRDALLGLDGCRDIPEKPSPETSQNGELNESEHVDVQLHRYVQEEKSDHRDVQEEKYEATGDGNTPDFYEYEEDYDDEDHDFFIQKLKSEIKRLKGPNLSVIPEESESDLFDSSSWDSESEEFMGANPSEDYSPSFRKLEPEEQESIEDFYEKYKDRMRHFDKLNYQHINTLGLLQMDQEARKFSKPQGVTKILRKSLSNKFQTLYESEDMKTRLEQGLETVYVGQTCLSWEALHWQYKMFKRMVLSGPEHDFFYDYVADQFQQFHVLLQRFLENEEFEGPRVLNYVNNRSVSKSLLYVPPLKGSIKEEEPGTGESMVTATQLVSMMEGCIVLFSEFVKADKMRSTMPSQLLLNFLCANQVLENPNDSTLLHSIRKHLHSKELQVKELQRRGRCIIKRLDPTTGEGLEILMALVDIKLVSRVLKMSRITTDQLQWCQKKLNKLSVTHRKVLHREPSTVLFPI